MLCNNFKVHYLHFSHCRIPNVSSSSYVRKSNVKKQRRILAPRKGFSAVSAGGSEVIAASLDRQFHDSAAQRCRAGLDSTVGGRGRAVKSARTPKSWQKLCQSDCSLF